MLFSAAESMSTSMCQRFYRDILSLLRKNIHRFNSYNVFNAEKNAGVSNLIRDERQKLIFMAFYNMDVIAELTGRAKRRIHSVPYKDELHAERKHIDGHDS